MQIDTELMFVFISGSNNFNVALVSCCCVVVQLLAAVPNRCPVLKSINW